MRQQFKLIVSALAAVAAMLTPAIATAQAYPSKPIKVIVPFAPGGQGDVFARLITKHIEDNKLLPQPIVVVNMPGGGATIGIRAAHKANSDGYTLLYIHQTLMTSELKGKLKFKYTDLDAIAETNNTCLLTATADGSGLKSGKDWVEQAKANPKGVKEATLLGSAAQFTTAMFARAAGIEVGYVNVGGGAKRIASLLGNHTKTAVLVAAPIAKNPKLHGLIYYGEKRNPKIPDVPTARELGYDVVACLNNIWMAPKGVPAEAVAVLTKAFKTALSDQKLIEQIEKRGQTARFVAGDELKTRLADIHARLKAVAGDL